MTPEHEEHYRTCIFHKVLMAYLIKIFDGAYVQSGTKPNLVAKIWLPNLVLYQTDVYSTTLQALSFYTLPYGAPTSEIYWQISPKPTQRLAIIPATGSWQPHCHVTGWQVSYQYLPGISSHNLCQHDTFRKQVEGTRPIYCTNLSNNSLGIHTWYISVITKRDDLA